MVELAFRRAPDAVLLHGGVETLHEVGRVPIEFPSVYIGGVKK